MCSIPYGEKGECKWLTAITNAGAAAKSVPLLPS